MKKKSQVAAIILIAGRGERFDATLPKQFHNLSGKKIYLHTLETFLRVDQIDEIILVCHKKEIDSITKETSSYTLKIVTGGLTRQESSYLGLLACNPGTEIVIIHDGVRPFVSNRIILENIKQAKLYGAVDTCIETFDTIVQTGMDDFIEAIPKRNFLLRGQTPQSFKYNLILKAHKQALKDKIFNSSDDCQLALNLGCKVYIVKGEDSNIKITNKLDLFIAEQLFRSKTVTIEKEKKSLKGKIFAIVGGTGGIGREIVSLLIDEEAHAIPLSPHTEISLDLTKPLTIKTAFQRIYKLYGKIDGLINSAGWLKISPLKKLSQTEIRQLVEINYQGLLISCKEAKIKEKGSIINIGSSSGFKGRENFSIYSSCKAAVVNFTQALAEELPKMKINTVIPQRTNTLMRRANFPEENIDLLLPPKRVAQTVVDLLKNEKLTGSIVEVKKEP
jgi:ribitol-5-phosphate 2-dehydrogenase (NADP+) / D-ribitol-5-phosphate cytidylyltransferase